MASALLSAPMAVARAFSPGHITGFYDRPKPQPNNLLLAGSIGAGFSIERGISTAVQIYESHQKSYRISINGKQTRDAEVSKWVIEKYLELVEEPVFISIEHDVGIPIGYGLGSSGAAALGLSYSLNSALRTRLTDIEAAQLAHIAEIECRTGLGTVIAEFVGGFEMRHSTGAPGVGKITSRALEGYKAVILCISPIATRKALAATRSPISDLGTDMLYKLTKDQSPQEFMRLAATFANKLGLNGGRCRVPIEALAKAGYLASVALFGETVFTLVEEHEAPKVKQILSAHKGVLLSCGVDGCGAKLL